MTATDQSGDQLAAPAAPAAPILGRPGPPRRVFQPEDGQAPADLEHERSYLLALLAVLWPSFIGPDPEAVGFARLVIALPTGHASWKIPAYDLDLFDHVLPMPAEGMPPEMRADPADTYRRVWDLTIGRISIAEQAAGVRAAERSRLRGALDSSTQLINTSDGPALYVPWAEVDRALAGGPVAADPAEADPAEADPAEAERARWRDAEWARGE